MQAERDYLLARIFPEFEERLNARRHHLEWVDLRVGVAVVSNKRPREGSLDERVSSVGRCAIQMTSAFLAVQGAFLEWPGAPKVGIMVDRFPDSAFEARGKC